MGKVYRFLDKIALGDLAFEATGDSLSELFATADPLTVGTNWTQDCRLSESAIDDLFFEWLNAIVYIKDAESVVFHDALATVRFDGESQRFLNLYGLLPTRRTGCPSDSETPNRC